MDRDGIFEILEDNSLRADFDAQFADLVRSLPGPVFTVSIDKRAHSEKYQAWQFDPYHYVLTCLVERYIFWLKRYGHVGDVVGEARGPWHDCRLRRAYRRLYERGGAYLSPSDTKARLISRELRLEVKSANVAALSSPASPPIRLIGWTSCCPGTGENPCPAVRKRREPRERMRSTSLSAAEKSTVTAACQHLIDDFLKPRFQPTIRPTQFNYPVDILGNWHGNRYRFILPRGNQDDSGASIRMRELRRARDAGRA